MIKQFTLNNGLRVLCEQLPHLRSVSMGVWVKAGSILESPDENGLSHFIEHMAFKGTEKRSAKQIAQEMDAVGGYLNAATSKLFTYYYAKVIDEDIELACDILSDIVISPSIEQKEVDKERNVVLEEIAMTDDSPEDVAYDLISGAVFGSQSLGQTILGPREGIERYSREDLIAFRKKHYSPMNACVAIAGNFDFDRIRDLMEKYFGAWQGNAGDIFPVNVANMNPCTLTAEKDTEQVHICLGYTGKPTGHQDIYPIAVFNSILGGGMSSRLFQRIREESGMAYSVYSTPSYYPHCGEFCVYAATSPKNIHAVLNQLQEETQLMIEKGMTAEEFRMAKAQLKGSFILGQESAYNRMNSMGSAMILQNRLIPTDETIRKIEAVTQEDAQRVAKEILSGAYSRAFVGKKINKLIK